MLDLACHQLNHHLLQEVDVHVVGELVEGVLSQRVLLPLGHQLHGLDLLLELELLLWPELGRLPHNFGDHTEYVEGNFFHQEVLGLALPDLARGEEAEQLDLVVESRPVERLLRHSEVLED